MNKFFKIGLLVLVALIFLGTLVFLFSKSQPKQEQYEIVKADTATIEQKAIATGKIEPRDEVQIKPQISGIIAELYKEAGQMVKKGDIIAKVKVIPEMGQLNAAQNRVRLAEMNRKQAETDLNRMEQLYKEKMVSSEEYEKVLLAARQAREELKAARSNLDIVREGITKGADNISSTLVRSTIDGLILDVPVKVGNSVIMSNTFNDGTTIASVADMNNLIFRGNIDELEVGKVYEGIPVRITLGALPELKLDAKLEYISPKSTENNGANQFEIKAAVTVPQGVRIRSGYSANAEIRFNKVKAAVSVPEAALEFRNDSAFVYVFQDDDTKQKFKQTFVKIGVSNGLKVEIKEGLRRGQMVRGMKKEVKL